ncbi:uncharacterized protein LOC129724331 [Wyeomyia smithii]|uniref:uncharacterized protein LOC129724331 n=1 Tax=Wyeomyia smithii TaxID=174621 RepID=UPI002467C555|nr:uncharacterized protein LOC129724331 [Wyeomyia smithii]
MLLTSMSFASMNIPECKPDDGEQDIDKNSYEQWKRLLEASMNLVGVTEESMKFNVFKIKAGRKLLEIFEGTISSPSMPGKAQSPYSNAIRRLDGYFGSRDYVLLQRQKLRSTFQKPDESDMCYVKHVIAVAKLCEYGEEQLLENVADVLLHHALNIQARKAGRKISRKGGSLADLMIKIRACEAEQLNEEIFAKNHRQDKQASIAAVGRSHPFQGRSSHDQRPRLIGPPSRVTTKRRGNDVRNSGS